MKIAISATGNGIDSEVDARFGRCPNFVIVEIEDKKIKKVYDIKNSAAGQMGGAGISASEIVANEKVEAVITVNMGPRAFTVFSQFNIKVYMGAGKVKDVINKFIEGKLKEISESNGPMYMGENK